jgi:TetR/AcrR family transcriptional repressor of nem operon
VQRPAPPLSSRRREAPAFDDQRVIGQAMLLFWARGYRGTTVSDLSAATGVAPQSLYGAFGDKHQLFLRALDRYTAEGLAALAAALKSAPTPLAGLRAYLDLQLALACGELDRRGCLMASTALELLPAPAPVAGARPGQGGAAGPGPGPARGDGAVADLVTRNFAAQHEVLTEAVERAQAAGEVAATRSPVGVAWQLWTRDRASTAMA